MIHIERTIPTPMTKCEEKVRSDITNMLKWFYHHLQNVKTLSIHHFNTIQKM